MRTGSVTDIPIVLVALLSLAIGIILASLVLSQVQAATTDSQINQKVLAKAQGALQVYNAGVALVATGLFSVSILFAWRIRSNPIFFVPSLFFLAVSVWLASELSNVFSLFVNSNGLILSTANNFPALQLLMEKLPLFAAVMGGVTLVALYVQRSRGVQGEVTA